MRTEALEEFGMYIRDKRVAKKLTQAEVSKICGYKSSQSVSNIERGIVPPAASMLKKLIKLYDLKERDILWRLTQIQMESWRSKLYGSR